MNNNGEAAKAGKRRRGGEGEDTIGRDRLSALPDRALVHILSFVDSKDAVQTCVLSRRWRCVWKQVPVLNFNRDTFEEFSGFETHVDRLLSLRYPREVHKLSYMDGDGGASWEDEPQRMGLFVRVMRYACSHNVQHLVIDLGSEGNRDRSKRCSDLFSSSISECKIESLDLGHVTLDGGCGLSCFQSVTSLILEWCLLSSDQGGEKEDQLDPFSKLPCLKHLVLSNCLAGETYGGGCKRSIKISGLELLSLVLDRVEFSDIEIHAPKLESFALTDDVGTLRGLSNLSLPSLNHADVSVWDDHHFVKDNKEVARQQFVSLFQGLHNAKSLKLYWETIEVMSELTVGLADQPSPFTRLTSLTLAADSVPYKLLKYFLKGSSSARPMIEYV
ncbi:unnamed protein product [Linum tenue]|uniref:F-box domain-containing protein n=1 Tax=Linum tenue TaxID=586396 RepID=A0AAV0M5T8_9ROSI|nr:unnamed protein product [Linum tenue]